jgi:hypothetical protein
MENGITVGKGRPALRDALPGLLEDADNALSVALRRIVARLRERWYFIGEAIDEADRQIKTIAATRDDCRRLLTIPGIGPLIATALVAAIGNGTEFKNGRTVAAWLGLVPRQCQHRRSTEVAWRDQARQPVPAAFAHSRRTLSRPTHQSRTPPFGRVGERARVTRPPQRRGRRVGQQARANELGFAHATDGLSPATRLRSKRIDHTEFCDSY